MASGVHGGGYKVAKSRTVCTVKWFLGDNANISSITLFNFSDALF